MIFDLIGVALPLIKCSSPSHGHEDIEDSGLGSGDPAGSGPEEIGNGTLDKAGEVSDHSSLICLINRFLAEPELLEHSHGGLAVSGSGLPGPSSWRTS